MLRRLAVVLCFGILAGCATQTYHLSAGADTLPTEKEDQTFLLFGVGQMHEVDATSVCGEPERVAKIESRQYSMNAFLSVITLGIYTPRTASVYCTE